MRDLVSLGFTADDLRALHAEGQFPAQPEDQQAAPPTAAARAQVAQEAVVLEVIDVRPELLGDGFRSTARLRVKEGLKGDLQPDDLVEVRLLSGLGSDGKFHQNGGEPVVVPGLPASLMAGSRWFMLLSEGVRAEQALRLAMRFAFTSVWLPTALMAACSQGGPANGTGAVSIVPVQGQARYATILEAPPAPPPLPPQAAASEPNDRSPK